MRPTGNAELDGFRAWLSCPELPETTRARRDTKKKRKGRDGNIHCLRDDREYSKFYVRWDIVCSG